MHRSKTHYRMKKQDPEGMSSTTKSAPVTAGVSEHYSPNSFLDIISKDTNANRSPVDIDDALQQQRMENAEDEEDDEKINMESPLSYILDSNERAESSDGSDTIKEGASIGLSPLVETTNKFLANLDTHAQSAPVISSRMQSSFPPKEHRSAAINPVRAVSSRPLSEAPYVSHSSPGGDSHPESIDLPYYLYSGTIHDSAEILQQKNEKLKVKNALIRGNSVARSQSDLELIKGNLSRHRSTRSNIYAKPNDRSKDPDTQDHQQNEKPLLFSQSHINNDEDASQTDAKTNLSEHLQEKTTSETYAENAQGGITPEKDVELNYDEQDFPLEEQSYLAPVTHETELNSLRYPRHRKNDDSLLVLAEINSPFQNINGGDSKAKSTNKRDENDKELELKQETRPEKNFRKPQNAKSSYLLKQLKKRKYGILIWVLIMVIIIIICVFVPFMVIYSRGSDSIVERYMNNITPEHKKMLLEKFSTGGASNFHQKPLIPEQITLHKDKAAIVDQKNLHRGSHASVDRAGISLFQNIPEKYQHNKAIREIMNNENLQNVFYGVDYAPRNVIFPVCGAKLHDVMLDVALLSQITSRIRTYGTQCSQARYVLDSIKALNLNVTLAMGVWIGSNADINRIQMQEMKNLLKTYPHDLFDSIYIGNEVLFREDSSVDQLIGYINEAKKYTREVLNWDIPVGTSELGSKANIDVMRKCDVFGTNVHPFFTGDEVEKGTGWVYDFVKYQVEPIKEELGPESPQLVISEIGWPYGGGKYQTAVAGKNEMQQFLNDWVCKAKTTDYPWFYFEAFDEPWKQVYHTEESQWETEWGLFTSDRKLKDGLVFPKC